MKSGRGNGALGGAAGITAIGAVVAAHLFLVPAPGARLELVALLGAVSCAGLFALQQLPRTLRAGALGAAIVFLRIVIGGLPIDPADQSDIVLDEVGETRGRVAALLAPMQGLQRFILESDGRRIAIDAPQNPTIRVGDEITALLEQKRQSAQSAERQRVRGIDAAATTRAVAVTGGGSLVEALRARIGDDLERVIPAPAGGLAAAIVVGLRERVDERLADAFTATGLGHVVALSGWNVAIAMAVADRLLRRYPAPRRRVLLIAIAIGYGLFAGASASVIRASLMAAAALVGASSGRPGSGAVALAHAVLGLLLLDPAIAYDPGFRLSALATAGLLAKSQDWSMRALQAGNALPSPLRAVWLRIAEEVAVALAAQAATLGVVIALFGRIALWSIPLTLAIAPFVAPATGAALIAVLAGELASFAPQLNLFATIAAAPAAALFAAMAWIAEAGNTLPLGGITVPRDATLPVGAALGILGVALLRRNVPTLIDRPNNHLNEERSRGRRSAALAGAALIAATVLLQGGAAAPADALRISILDVGQGDAILVESRGARMLIDGGPDPARLSAELDRIVPSWDRRIDLVIATHPHEDHLAGLPRLADRYRVRSVAGAEERGTGPAITSWKSLLAVRKLPYATLTAGDRFSVGAAKISVLWPDKDTIASPPANGGRSLNDRSIVLRLDIPGFSALFTGDAESDVDGRIATRIGSPVDLLKSPHHGSATSSSRALVSAAKARISIVSAGKGNPYGHPAATTLERLGELGGTVVRTDRDGTIVVSVLLDGSGLLRATNRGGRIIVPPRSAIHAPQAAEMLVPDALLPARSVAVARSADAVRLPTCAIAPATIPAWQPNSFSLLGVTTSS